MFFDVQNLKKLTGRYPVEGKIRAVAHASLCKPVFAEYWNNFSYGLSEIELLPTDSFTFCIGQAPVLPLDGESYRVSITESGMSLAACSEKSLICGFMTLIDRLLMERVNGESRLFLDACTYGETAFIARRMAHFCVFPETELWEIRRFVRLCAFLRYTHLVIEFWGTFRYACLDALSWERAFSADDLREIFAEAQDLGMELVPMFNHYGHASSGRVMHGKHVVLDQSPQYAYLFDETGWAWNIGLSETIDLQKKMRQELTELCGAGSFFHIGCDEIYGFDYSERAMEEICTHINAVAQSLAESGRKPILWADMFLPRTLKNQTGNTYTAACPSENASSFMLSKLDKNVLLADWQYDACRFPVETSLYLKEKGFSVLLCPWDRGMNRTNACLETAKIHGLDGILHTTWHTLSSGMPYVAKTARGCFLPAGAKDVRDENPALHFNKTAEILRKVYPCGGDYRKSGWSKKEIEDIV
ncbi:MAG: family 20 glycosylhydrolase [Eubacteriales bacterium]|jgi:hypothetical protein